tara:strand:+ start:3055 stop:3885 length:831 start_codon:yes stop_codon:yes gene_type:complete
MKKIKFNKTIKDFGDEWEKFDNKKVENKELKKIFNTYFRIFPKKIFNKKNIGIDLGSGSGRWAKYIAPMIKKMYLLEPSVKAINVSKKRLQKFKNIEYLNIEINKLNLKSSSLDFAYSLGVIHHLNYPTKCFKIINNKLKKNSPFLVYLYHDFENHHKFYKLIWLLSEYFRKFISKKNFFIKSLLCEIIAIVIYFPLAKISYFLDILNIDVKNVPLSIYKDKSFYIMRNDSLDRFGTKYEKRYSTKDIINLFEKTGFYNIKVSSKEPYWCVIGYKK